MRIYQFIDTHPPTRRCGERSDGIRIHQKSRSLGAPSLQERAEVRLVGLLERPKPEPVVGSLTTHEEVTIVEEQYVR